jgi:TrpR family trp operon transcriptional repressor
MKADEELADVFCRIGERKQMLAFFDEIFTPAERKDLLLRWKLMKMLKNGITQRKIVSELGISLCKITRGSKIIHNRHSVTNRMLNQLGTKKEKKA